MIKNLVPLVGILTLGAAQGAVAVNFIDPDDHDWGWEAGAEPTFPNEAYGPEDMVDIDDNAAGKKNDGDNQLFDVWVPDGVGPFPVFIHAHGGGFTGGSKKRYALAGPLLANDHVVFVDINYRLGQGAGVAIEDGVDCLEYLKANAAKYKINPEQIFVGGGSAGGIIFNSIAYNESVSGIKGLWMWNLYQNQSLLTNEALMDSLDLPVVHAHPEPYPWDNSHSAKDAFEHCQLNLSVGNRSTFFKALNEHPSMIGYEDPYDQIQQIWVDGTWHLDYAEFDSDKNSPTFEQAIGEPIIDTGHKMLNLSEWIYTTVPAAPGASLSAQGGDSSVILSWDLNTDPEFSSYSVYRSETNGGSYSALATGLVTSNYIDHAVTNGTTYYYYIGEVDTNGVEQASGEVSAMPGLLIANLAAESGDHSIALQWDQNLEPTFSSYTVYRSETSGGPYSTLATGLATSGYVDYSTANGTTYYYTIGAVDAGAGELGSPEIAATAAKPIAPFYVMESELNVDPGIHFTENFDGNDYNVWNAKANFGSYDGSDIRSLSGNNNGRSVTISIQAGQPGFDDVGFQNTIALGAGNYELSYYYKVRSFGNADSKAGVRVLTAHQDATGTDNIIRIDLGVSSFTEVQDPSVLGTATWAEAAAVQWTADADGIQTMPFTVGAGEDVILQFWSLLGADFYDIDDVRVRTLDAAAPTAPANLTAAPGNNQISLEWDDNAELDLFGYRVYRSLSPGGPWGAPIVRDLSISDYVDTTAVNGTTYYYVVSAMDTVNESVLSAEVSATPAAADPEVALDVSPAGMVITWNSTSNLAYDVFWSSNLVDGIFQPLETNLYYPVGSYTDGVHGAESQGYYKINGRPE